MSLKRRVENKGYVLVNKERWMLNERLKHNIRSSEDRYFRCQQALSDAYDRITELEAEVEAHKRVEAKLAERAMTQTVQEDAR